MKPEITLIKKSGPNPVMSKRIFLDAQGKVCSDGSQCLMAQGTATRATAETAADLAKHIMACGTEQAIVLGALRADLASPAKITTDAKLKDNPDAIARSRDFIDYCPGTPAWALIDFDTKGMPDNVASSIRFGVGSERRRASMTFRRIIVYPGGREEIENVTPKQLPAPASHTFPREDEIEVGPSEIKELDA